MSNTSGARHNNKLVEEDGISGWFEGGSCRLAYSRYGRYGPIKLFYFHGSPGSRLEAQTLAQQLDTTRFDLVAIDRPGMGLSHFEPGYDLASHSSDILALADDLGWSEYAAIGYSGGAATLYSLAAAAQNRMRFGLDVSGWAPVADNAELARMIQPIDRVFSRLAKICPYLVNLGFWPLAAASQRKDADRLMSLLEASFSESDRALLDIEFHRDQLLETVREAFRQGRSGATRDAVLRFRPWGFDLADLNIPFLLVQGDADQIVPFEIAQWKQRRLRYAHLYRIGNAGHLGLFKIVAAKIRAASDWLYEPSGEIQPLVKFDSKAVVDRASGKI
jgi:pimeloyl-ACP methyl ester carboxylesterase